MRDDGTYADRRREFRRMITVYGRKTALEALRDPTLHCATLHLARSNRGGGIVGELRAAAAQRGVSVQEHSREALARISRNGRQDQGVALDVRCPHIDELDEFLARERPKAVTLLAFDGVTNPQNMGMALRSAVAAGVDGVLYADRGNPALGPLVIKASAGTVFRAPLLRCADVASAARACIDAGFSLYRLRAGGARQLFAGDFAAHSLFVLGGETDGVSEEVCELQGEDLAIPMSGGVESLNVAVSAALVAYAAGRQGYFAR